MIDNTFPRAKEVRAAATAKLRGNWGNAALCTLIYLAISIVGSLFTGYYGGAQSRMWHLYLQLVGLVYTFCILGPLGFGYKVGMLRHIRGEQPDSLPTRLFDAFRQYGRYMGTSALYMLFLDLWALICIPVAVIPTLFYALAMSMAASKGTIIVMGTCFALVGLIPMWVMYYAYALTPYIMHDEPQTSAYDCIVKSRRMMRGYKWKLFCLDLSYIGWLLLVVVTLGIMSLWVMPRIECAHAQFYEEMKERQIDESIEGENFENF